MQLNLGTIGFLTGLILSLISIDKAVTFPSKSVDTLAQSQDIVRLAQMTLVQVEKLISWVQIKTRDGTEFKVILPTYIPPDFQVHSFIVNDYRDAYYNIFSRNYNNFCFSIKGASGGFISGGIDSEKVEFDSPALG
ncbi:MAG: hypothetical protein QNJ68_07780 [Microcoleaceae cyanobacterium MO_207.B10]|nr:hypothetical protein [Microcoleaceae cyanobacterium MO_207.B10]